LTCIGRPYVLVGEGCGEGFRLREEFRSAWSSHLPLPTRLGSPSSQAKPRTPAPPAPRLHAAWPPAQGRQHRSRGRFKGNSPANAGPMPAQGLTERALAPLRASEGRRTCRVSGPRRGGCSRGGQRGAPGRTAPRSPRSAPSQPGALPEHVSRPWLDVGRYWRPDAVRRGPTPTRPRRARCADPVRPSRPLASACRSRQPP
jgi:hypothetical protein